MAQCLSDGTTEPVLLPGLLCTAIADCVINLSAKNPLLLATR